MATQLFPNIAAEPQTKDLGSSTEVLGVDPKELQHTLKLAGLLQTTLEVRTVLEYFLSDARTEVEFDAAHYQNAELKLELQFNDAQKHKCAYQLRLAEHTLGELTFSNKRRFTQKELERLENLLCQLVYPLRNAIMYQKAVMAAQKDALTGANNRAAMDTTLAREVELAHRHKTPLSLIVIDVDYFKDINDKYGHNVGDTVLQQLTQCLNSSIRGCDILYRYGGEEFTILLTNTNEVGAEFVAERVRKSVASYKFTHNGNTIPATISLGLACLDKGDDSTQLFCKADAALYEAKNNGRNQAICYSVLNSGLSINT